MMILSGLEGRGGNINWICLQEIHMYAPYLSAKVFLINAMPKEQHLNIIAMYLLYLILLAIETIC